MSDPGQHAALARDLALCLLDSGFGLTPDETPSTLLVGELPRDLPYPLPVPVPDGSRVLGTLVRRLPVVVLAAALTTEAALAFYAERLAAAGWPMTRGGVEEAAVVASSTPRVPQHVWRPAFMRPMDSTLSPSWPRPPQAATASPSCSRPSPVSRR
jgi:hypothetical protein